ncbi:MAG: mevalonate kinase [Caldilineaceae bacterium]|nr:mevalonate kinase [Caldilineaceae bacterium]
MTTSRIIPPATATAPGKIILVGEHAVVYGRPAIAAPVRQVRATATVSQRNGTGVLLVAPQIGLSGQLVHLPDDHPLARVTRLTLDELGLDDPNWQIQLTSTIPIAGGLGSGAAVNAALVRALFAYASGLVNDATVSRLVYAGEQLHHGTPSGIDNTVIAYGEPVWFIKDAALERFTPGARITLVIGDSGIPAPTRETVAAVRAGWEADPLRYEGWFDAIARIARQAKNALEAGNAAALGRLFDENQTYLARLGVSSPKLELLLAAARHAGALGAKLSGGGRGGNVIALVDEDAAAPVSEALLAAGAARVIVTNI